jgi:hypothetical protein
VIWTPRRPYVPTQKLPLDDSGFAILGNALLAVWWNALRRQRGHDRRAEGQEASESVELRDVLDREEVLDDAFAGPFRPDGDYLSESLDDLSQRVQAALNSAEWFAMVSISTIDFSRCPPLPVALQDALAAASPSERRTPIARLRPSSITRELRSFVIDYFFRHGGAETSQMPASTAGKGGPRQGSDRARERTAIRVLQTIYACDPDARLTREDANALLSSFFESKNARERIWAGIEAPKWKPSGRPPKAQHRADGDLIRARLSEALK